MNREASGMAKIITIPVSTFLSDGWGATDQSAAIAALEESDVVLVPGLTMSLTSADEPLFASSTVLTDGVNKNITLDPYLEKITGIAANSQYRSAVEQLLIRYKSETEAWLVRLLGEQGRKFEARRTTFRPVEIRSREKIGKVAETKAYRYDDTRLHADAFKRRPMGARRIFRIFSNLNPDGKPRVWKVGDDFEAYAKRYLDRIRSPYPGELSLKNLFRVTHWRRTHYDHIMLNLHDLGKLDEEFQNNSPQTLVEFPANSTWFCFTDSVLHAALAGCYAAEQTFEISYRDMVSPERSPQMTLERLKGVPLL
jgi:hypothetical protein